MAAGDRVSRILCGGVATPLGRLLARPRRSGLERVPASGGAVLAFSHRGWLDALLALQATRRPIAFVVAAEYVRMPVVGLVLRAVGAIPVERGSGELDWIETAAAGARAGGLVGIFPEGAFHRGEGVGRVRRGAARIAGRAGVPLIPVGIGGSPLGLPWRRRAFVRVGSPLAVRDEAEATAELRSALARLVAAP